MRAWLSLRLLSIPLARDCVIIRLSHPSPSKALPSTPPHVLSRGARDAERLRADASAADRESLDAEAQDRGPVGPTIELGCSVAVRLERAAFGEGGTAGSSGDVSYPPDQQECPPPRTSAPTRLLDWSTESIGRRCARERRQCSRSEGVTNQPIRRTCLRPMQAGSLLREATA
jgi:hypothetical protein